MRGIGILVHFSSQLTGRVIDRLNFNYLKLCRIYIVKFLYATKGLKVKRTPGRDRTFCILF